MILKNDIITAKISAHGAELKSVVKNGHEYMWQADPKFWGRTSPVLFPFVGGMFEKKYKLNGIEYPMGQHGFARDSEFELVESTDTTALFELKSTPETMKIYPFEFTLLIKYTLDGDSIRIEWTVKNENDREMLFAIGGHPAFNINDGQNYFKFDYDKDIMYRQIDSTGLYDAVSEYILENDGYAAITKGMFDNDALIIEEKPIHEVSLCGSDKKPYVTVTFDAPLFGLWSPGDSPFICIEPWYGRCDRSGFDGELKDKDYIYSIDADKEFKAEYTMKFI